MSGSDGLRLSGLIKQGLRIGRPITLNIDLSTAMEDAITRSPTKPIIPSPAGRRRLGAFYDRMAPLYDLWVELFETKARRRAEEILNIQSAETLLEVAIGPGRHFIRLAQNTDLKMSVGMDLSSRMLKLADRRLKRIRRINIHLCRGDAIALPFRDGGFDRVLSCYMLDLLDERDLPVVLAEFKRVLKATGKLVVINMAEQSPFFNRLWMSIYRHNPVLVGGCRPIELAAIIEQCGWRILQREEIRQSGFRSELVSAKLIEIH